MKVSDIMTKNVIIVGINDTLDKVLKTLSETKVSGVPVVEGGYIVGVLSESDVLKIIEKDVAEEESELKTISDIISPQKLKLLAEAISMKKLQGIKVQDIMKKNPIVIDSEATIHEAAKLMSKHDVNRLPIVSNNKLVGIVSREDMIKGLALESAKGEIVKKEEPESERVEEGIKTEADRLLKFVEEKKTISIKDAAKELGINEETVEKWGKILEEHGLIILYYPAMGVPELRVKK